MGGDTKILNEILETVIFLKDNAVTKNELEEKLSAVKTELRNEIITHVDGFITLHKKLDTEYAALYYKYDRLETRVEKLEKRS